MTQLLASSGDVVKIWDVFAEEEVKVIGENSGRIPAVRWNHSNQVIVSVNASGSILLSFYETGATIGRLPSSTENHEETNTLCFSEGSRYLCTGGENVHIWDLKKREVIRKFKGHTDNVTCVKFSSQDRYVASSSLSGSIIIHNVLTGNISATLRPDRSQYMGTLSLDYSQLRPHILASCGDDGSVDVWDVNRSALDAEFPVQHESSAKEVKFSPVNLRLLASAGLDKRIHFFDISEKRHVKELITPSSLTSLAFAVDGYTLCAGSQTGEIYVYDLRSGSQPRSILTAHCPYPTYSLDFQKANAVFKNKDHVSPMPQERSEKKEKPEARSHTSIVTKPEIKEDVSHTTDSVNANRMSVDEIINQIKSSAPLQSQTSQEPKTIHTSTRGTEPEQDVYPNTMHRPVERSSKASEMQKRNEIPQLPASISSKLQEGALPHKPETEETKVQAQYKSQTSKSGQLGEGVSHDMKQETKGNRSIDQVAHDLRPQLSQRAQKSDTRWNLASSPIQSSDTQSQSFHKEDKHERFATQSEAHEITPQRPHSIYDLEEESMQSASGFHLSLLQSVVDDSLMQFRNQIHADIQNMHLELIRQFAIQKNEIAEVLEHHTERLSYLMEENRALRKELKNLRNLY